MFKKVISIISVLLLTACATGPEYNQYLQAQSEANKQAVEHQKPLVRLVAQPGMAITGLHSLEVYTPSQAPVIQQARPSEWAAVAQTGLSTLATLGGIKLGGDAVIGLASQVKQAGTFGYQYVKAPGTSFTNSFNSDSTHAPTVVNQPAPIVVNQPAPTIVDPVIVTQPPPVIVTTPTP